MNFRKKTVSPEPWSVKRATVQKKRVWESQSLKNFAKI